MVSANSPENLLRTTSPNRTWSLRFQINDTEEMYLKGEKLIALAKTLNNFRALGDTP